MGSITVRQHVKLLPKNCFQCPPCVKQENTYSVYAGHTSDNEKEILRIDEVSDDWNRCCCQPYHPLKMEVRQYIPMPNANTTDSSDAAHLSDDFKRDFSSFSGANRQRLVDDLYKNQPVLMTMLRDDGQRCCCKMPCKMLSSFVCFGCCQDGMHVYAGALEDDTEIGRPNQPNVAKLIGSVQQPVFGGCCTPTLHLRDVESPEPFAKVEGPCFFGGWSEMCFNFQFFVSRFASDKKSGDLGLITKKKPSSMAGGFVEVMSDADVYGVTFNEHAELTPAQKITMLTSQILADYMWFEGNTEKCKRTESGTTCYCCFFSCIGALCPIYLHFPSTNSSHHSRHRHGH
jgi:hypothetical protein